MALPARPFACEQPGDRSKNGNPALQPLLLRKLWGIGGVALVADLNYAQVVAGKTIKGKKEK
jgi:hypothetical protein